LSQKETNVLKIESTSSNLGEEFLKLVPKEIFFSGINEKGKKVRILCDDYLEYLKLEKMMEETIMRFNREFEVFLLSIRKSQNRL
jgi:hypothetical protein